MGLDVRADSRAGWQMLLLKGRLDDETAPELLARLRSLLAGHPLVAVDCSELAYVSSAGLAVLIEAARAAQAASHRFCVCGPTEAVRKVFEISGIAALVAIQESMPC